MSYRLWSYAGRLLVGLCLVVTGRLSAQQLPYSAVQRQQLDKLRQTIQKNHDANYSRALSLAKTLGRPITLVHNNGQIVSLAGVDDRGNLLYHATHVGNAQVANITRTSSLYSGGSLGLNLSGSSASVQNKLGIWDGAAVRSSHVELKGRVTQNDKASTTVDDEEHPTHVATTMIGAGVNPQVRGMAFGAKLQAWDYNSDATEMSTAASNLLISNHSYGYQAGYQYNPSRSGSTQWEWYGDTTVNRIYDYKFGQYDTQSQSWDKIANSAPYYLIVKSAGNDHAASGYTAGESYVMVNHNNKVSKVPRDLQTGYDQISTNGVAKNILSVGAANYPTYGYNRPGDVVLADFSSWGPADDGRIKPDIVGIGVNILSGNSSNDSAYVSLSGTSMSSPNVSGSLLLLQEYYAQLNSGQYMRSSTLRGLVLHTAYEAGPSPGPDYQFGWGLLNTEKAARVIGNTDKTNLLSERTLAQGQRDTIQVVASGHGPLVATICWNDPAGTPTSTVNDRTPKLVNDLDLRITNGTITSSPWILDPDNPSKAATTGDNIRDNIEQVYIENAVPGKTYTIVITNKATLSGNKQDYALIVSGIGGQAYCASLPGSSADTKINAVNFSTISQTNISGCTTYSDFTQQTVGTVQANQTLPLSVTTGTCGASNNVVIKAFADWNANGNFTDAGDNMATSGVLNGPGVFTTNITIPQSVSLGQLIRLRIVATETSDPASVNPCGTYGNGETQDYLLRVIQTSNDVGAASLLSPIDNLCATSDLTVSVEIQNYGSQAQTNVPVTVAIIDASKNTISTLSGTLGTLPAYGAGQVALSPGNLTLTPGQTYTFVATTGLASDQNSANNQFVTTRTVALAATGGIFAATSCGIDTAFYLTNKGNATAFWYDAPTGGNLLAAGNGVAYNGRPTGGIFYAGLNEFSGRLGPAAKSDFGGGSYAYNFGPSPLITTTVPITLSSARLYIGHSGTLTFTVTTLSGSTVSSVSIPVVATRTLPLSATATNGMLADDPNDPGAVYALNLKIPQAGTYQINIDYADSAAIFRSNVGVSGFPFRLTTATGQTVVSTKGSLYQSSSTSVDTLTNAWYYFYDLQIKSADCPSASRVAVTPTTGVATTASITPNAPTSICSGSTITLQANTGNGLTYQWYRNGAAISAATGSTFQVASAGQYSVQVTGVCTPVVSSAVSVSVTTATTPTINVSGFTLTTNAVSGVQWLFNGVAISGANSTTYAVTQTGRYSVRGNVNGCGELISSEVYLTILAAEPTVADNILSVYPNPTTSQVTVSLSSANAFKQMPTVHLTDLKGATVLIKALQQDGKNYSTVLDVSTLPGGTFFVVIKDDETQNVWVRRISKQ